MQTNEEVGLYSGDTSWVDSPSISIYPLAYAPLTDELLEEELARQLDHGENHRWHDLPPGSYLVVVRWSRPNGSRREEQWPRGNIMTTKIPFTVE